MADTFKIKKPQAVFRRNLRLAPAAPRGDRVLVREMPPESMSEGGLAVADVAKERLFAGWIVAAGLKALDIMHDCDDQLGDQIMYAKYAGVVGEWKHIVGRDDLACAHDSVWDHVAKPSATLEGLGSKRDPEAVRKWSLVDGGPNDNVTLRECRSCGTLMVTERVIVMNIDDIMLNIDAQERLEAGQTAVIPGVTEDGQTQHVIQRQQTKEAA